MKNLISLSSSLLVLVTLALGGCATTADDGAEDVAIDVDLGVSPNRLGAGRSGYQPRVMLADLRAAGASCIGTHCVFNGQDWDCSGGGYCSNVSR